MIIRPVDFYTQILALFATSHLANNIDAATQIQVENAILNALSYDDTKGDPERLGVRLYVHSGALKTHIGSINHVRYLNSILEGLALWFVDALESLMAPTLKTIKALTPLDPEHPTTVLLVERAHNYAAARTDTRPSEAYAIVSPNQIQILEFHEGTNPVGGVNGVLNEDLIAILAHRTHQHQSGPFASRENALCATALEQAGLWMYLRRVNRKAAGTSGTQKV